MHRRRRVREGMITRLVEAGVTMGSIVGHRAASFNASDFPAVRVFVREEDLDLDTVTLLGDSEVTGRVRMNVTVAVITRSTDTQAEIQADDISEAVEAAVRADPTLGGACDWCSFRSSEIDFENDEQTTIQAALTFEAFANQGAV